jgi:hypothetical protein
MAVWLIWPDSLSSRLSLCRLLSVTGQAHLRRCVFVFRVGHQCKRLLHAKVSSLSLAGRHRETGCVWCPTIFGLPRRHSMCLSTQHQLWHGCQDHVGMFKKCNASKVCQAAKLHVYSKLNHIAFHLPRLQFVSSSSTLSSGMILALCLHVVGGGREHQCMQAHH